MKDTIVVNLFGGPGIAKSTTAAGIFSLLKMHDIDCEYVPEFAKDLVWEERHKSLKNQIYIFSKQYHRLWRVNGIVNVIITDSPLILSLVYAHISGAELFKSMVLEEYHTFNNMNFLLERTKRYNPNGRYQDEKGALEVDKDVVDVLKKYDIYYDSLKGDHTAVNSIAGRVLNMFNKEQIYKIEKIVPERIV